MGLDIGLPIFWLLEMCDEGRHAEDQQDDVPLSFRRDWSETRDMVQDDSV